MFSVVVIVAGNPLLVLLIIVSVVHSSCGYDTFMFNITYKLAKDIYFQVCYS